MAFHQQATTLNVAVNASNKALLTIMMSNNVSSTVFSHARYFSRLRAGERDRDGVIDKKLM